MKDSMNASIKNWGLVICFINLALSVGTILMLIWFLHHSGVTNDMRVNPSISARKFVLVDSSGVPAAILGFADKGDHDAQLKFLNPKGETMLVVGFEAEENYPGISLSNGKEAIAAFGLDEYQLPYIHFFQKGSIHTQALAKTGGASFYLNAQGLPSLRFYDKMPGHCPLWLFLDDEKDNRPQIYLDKNGYDLTSIVESTLPPMIRKRPVK